MISAIFAVIQGAALTIGGGYLAYLFHKDGAASTCPSDKQGFYLASLVSTVVALTIPLHFIFADTLSSIVLALVLIMCLGIGFIIYCGLFVDMWTGQVGLLDTLFDEQPSFMLKVGITLAIIAAFLVLPWLIIGDLILTSGIFFVFLGGLCSLDHCPVWANKYLD